MSKIREGTFELKKKDFLKLMKGLKGIKRGGAVVRLGGERISVPSNALYEVEHDIEGDDEELELELRWKRGERIEVPSLLPSFCLASLGALATFMLVERALKGLSS